jgi:site-specific DNA-methyltransferase (adenine-specific)
MQAWWRSIWPDIKGRSTKAGHPAPYPVEIAERLIKMFSFAGDTVLDPFAGTGSTNVVALSSGRNSIGNEIESAYLEIAHSRLLAESAKEKSAGAIQSIVSIDRAPRQHLTKANNIAVSVVGPLP